VRRFTVLEGKVTDYGDLLHVERWIVKGRRLRFTWHIGPVERTTAADRQPGTSTPDNAQRRADIVMDLKADQKVALTGQWRDEMQNPVPAPAGASVVFTVDNGTVINLVDNADGTALATAVGVLGTANVHAVANAPGLPEATGDLQIVVVAGDAQRFDIVPGVPEEATPDV
jgi:hypothetical protein